jgi:hypothetical protein
MQAGIESYQKIKISLEVKFRPSLSYIHLFNTVVSTLVSVVNDQMRRIYVDFTCLNLALSWVQMYFILMR